MDARESTTRLAAGLSITGDITAHEDIAIDGRVEGSLHLPEHHLDVRERAGVHAKIVASSVTILGTVEGTVVASGRVVIGPGARVRGHLQTSALTLHDGAQFTGTVDPDRTAAAMQVAKYRQKQAEPAKIV